MRVLFTTKFLIALKSSFTRFCLLTAGDFFLQTYLSFKISKSVRYEYVEKKEREKERFVVFRFIVYEYIFDFNIRYS